MDQLKDIIEQLPDFIYWKDKNSVFQGCNLNFAKAAGFKSPEEIIGKTDYDLVWKDTHAKSYQESDKEVLDGVNKLNFIETQLRKDNKVVIVLASKKISRDKSGKEIGVIGSYIDITHKTINKNDKNLYSIQFTSKQKSYLIDLVRGLTSKQIALKSNVSHRTVEHTFESLKFKLHCKTKTQLIEKSLTLDFVKAAILYL